MVSALGSLKTDAKCHSGSKTVCSRAQDSVFVLRQRLGSRHPFDSCATIQRGRSWTRNQDQKVADKLAPEQGSPPYVLGQDGSVTASSTSSIGMLSRTGYTRRHAPHFRLSPVSLSTSGFLQTGQTSISRRSWGIMASILRQIQNRLRALGSGLQERRKEKLGF